MAVTEAIEKKAVQLIVLRIKDGILTNDPKVEVDALPLAAYKKEMK
jgi:hypothetical protein